MAFRYRKTPIGKIYRVPEEYWDELDCDNLVLEHMLLVLGRFKKDGTWMVRVATITSRFPKGADPEDYVRITWGKREIRGLQLHLSKVPGQLNPLGNKPETYARFDECTELPLDVLWPCISDDGVHLELNLKSVGQLRKFIADRDYRRNSQGAAVSPIGHVTALLEERLDGGLCESRRFR